MQIHDRPQNYVAVAEFLKDDEKSLGALVTTHKIDLYHACQPAGVFDYFDNYAAMLEEISCISKLEGRYEGHAKDPLTAGLAFEALVWEFNYRGELDFLRQARANQAERRLTIEDGWIYFIHGWTRVIAEVFHVDIPTFGPMFDDLGRIAQRIRK